MIAARSAKEILRRGPRAWPCPFAWSPRLLLRCEAVAKPGGRESLRLRGWTAWVPRSAVRAFASARPEPDPEADNPLDVLGLPEDFTEKELRQAYLRAAMRYHPDMNPGDERATRRFKAVSAAYELLSDPQWQERRGSRLYERPTWEDYRGVWRDRRDIWREAKRHHGREAREVWGDFMADKENLLDAISFYFADLRQEVHIACTLLRTGGPQELWPLLRSHPAAGTGLLLGAAGLALALRSPPLAFAAARGAGRLGAGALRLAVCFFIPHVVHIFTKARGGETIWQWLWKCLIAAAERARGRRLKLEQRQLWLEGQRGDGGRGRRGEGSE